MDGPTDEPRIKPQGGYVAKQCPERAHKDHCYDPALREPDSPFTLSIMEAGIRYETEIGDRLAAAMDTVVVDCAATVDPDAVDRLVDAARAHTAVHLVGDRSGPSLAARERATHRLLAEPGSVRFVWNARLRRWRQEPDGTYTWSTRTAEPDWLYRQDRRPDGTWAWGPGDVKHHKVLGGQAAPRDWAVSSLAAPDPASAQTRRLAGPFRLDDAMQLAHYQRALEFHGHGGDPVGGIIGKPVDGAHVVVWIDLRDRLFERAKVSALDVYDREFARRLDVIDRAVACRTDPSLASLAGPEWKSECKTCPWRTVCHDELVEADHITLLPGITPQRAAAHYRAGVRTVRQLAALDVTTATLLDAKIPGLAGLVADARSGRLPADTPAAALLGGTPHRAAGVFTAAGVVTVGDLARLDDATLAYEPGPGNLVAAIDQARVTDYARVRKLTHVFRARGVERVEVPRAPVEIHVDMENDENHIYLWGTLLVTRAAGRTTADYVPFVSFDATDAAEAETVGRFWRWFDAQRTLAKAAHGPDGFRAFYYTGAEVRCLRHLADKHAGVPGVPRADELDELFASADWVDLYPLLTRQLVWPTEDLSLKSLAKYVRFMWRDEDPSGAASVVWYATATDPDAPAEERAAMRQRILEYNEDDVRATAALVDWVARFAEVRNPNRKLPSVADLDARYRRRAARAA